MGLLNAIAGGVGVLGFIQDQSNKKASAKAVQAQVDAANANRALYEKQYNQTRDDLAPARGALAPSVNAAMVRAGLAPIPAGGPQPQSQPPTNPGAYSSLPGARPANQPQSAPQSAPASQAPAGAPGNQRSLADIQRDYAARVAAGETNFGQPTYRTTFMDGTPTPPGTYIGPNDQLLPIPGASPAGAPQTLPAEPSAPPSAAPPSAPPAPTSAGGPDWQAYLAANPDVAAEYQRASAAGDPNSPAFTQKGLQSPETFAQWHYQTYGQGEGRNLPNAPGTQTAAPADPNAPPPEYYEETYGARPDALDVPDYQRGPEMQRDPAMQFQDYGSGPQFSWDPSQIANDAGFKFETAETTKGVNAGAAARGKLRSGDAAKALQDRLFGVAHTYGNDYFSRALSGYGANRSAFESNRGYGTDLTKYQQNRGDNIFALDRSRLDQNYDDDRAYGTNLWQTVQGRNDNIFDVDRGFAANRNDQDMSNLFNLTNIGLSGASGTASAGNTFATNTAAQNSNVADARSNATLWNAQNRNNLYGSAARLAGSFMTGGAI